MEHQPQVKSLQEISDSLLIKGQAEHYIEAEEKVHVIEKKVTQLLEQVSQDLKSLQRSQVSPLVAFKCKDVILDANRKAVLHPCFGRGGFRNTAGGLNGVSSPFPAGWS